MRLAAPHNHAMIQGCTYIHDVEKDVRPWLPLLIREMRRNDGISISANQVGKTSAVFITDVPGDHIRIFINPEIIDQSNQEVIANEGCLSFPGKHLHTNRKRHVVIRASSLNGHEFVVDTKAKYYSPETSAMLAVCLQHEMDHMIGIDMREYL